MMRKQTYLTTFVMASKNIMIGENTSDGKARFISSRVSDNMVPFGFHLVNILVSIGAF